MQAVSQTENEENTINTHQLLRSKKRDKLQWGSKARDISSAYSVQITTLLSEPVEQKVSRGKISTDTVYSSFTKVYSLVM